MGKIQASLRSQPEKKAHHERRVKMSLQRALEREQVRFCELQEDYFAMASPNSRIGEMLFLPFERRMPLLLRSVQTGRKERFIVVEKAYVHGFIDNDVRKRKMPSVLSTLT